MPANFLLSPSSNNGGSHPSLVAKGVIHRPGQGKGGFTTSSAPTTPKYWVSDMDETGLEVNQYSDWLDSQTEAARMDRMISLSVVPEDDPGLDDLMRWEMHGLSIDSRFYEVRTKPVGLCSAKEIRERQGWLDPAAVVQQLYAPLVEAFRCWYPYMNLVWDVSSATAQMDFRPIRYQETRTVPLPSSVLGLGGTLLNFYVTKMKVWGNEARLLDVTALYNGPRNSQEPLQPVPEATNLDGLNYFRRATDQFMLGAWITSPFADYRYHHYPSKALECWEVQALVGGWLEEGRNFLEINQFLRILEIPVGLKGSDHDRRKLAEMLRRPMDDSEHVGFPSLVTLAGKAVAKAIPSIMTVPDGVTALLSLPEPCLRVALEWLWCPDILRGNMGVGVNVTYNRAATESMPEPLDNDSTAIHKLFFGWHVQPNEDDDPYNPIMPLLHPTYPPVFATFRLFLTSLLERELPLVDAEPSWRPLRHNLPRLKQMLVNFRAAVEIEEMEEYQQMLRAYIMDDYTTQAYWVGPNRVRRPDHSNIPVYRRNADGSLFLEQEGDPGPRWITESWSEWQNRAHE